MIMNKTFTKMMAMAIVALLCLNGNLKADELVAHEPGVYTTTYEQALVTYDDREYEIYAAKRGTAAAIPVLAAGGNAGYAVATGANLSSLAVDWFVADAINGTQQPGITSSDQFSGLTIGYWQFRNSNGITLKVKGYDEIAFVISDAHASTSGRQFLLTINGEDESELLKDHSTSATIRSIELDPDIESTVELKSANYNSNHSFYGFSLRIAESTTPSPCTPSELSFSDDVEAEEGDVIVAPTLVNALNLIDITYSSSDPAVVTVDENTGELTSVGEGAAIITASAPAQTVDGVDYCETEATYTVTITENSGTSNLNDLNASKAIESVQYYNVLGSQVDASAQGLVIVKTIYEDGSYDVAKVYNAAK